MDAVKLKHPASYPHHHHQHHQQQQHHNYGLRRHQLDHNHHDQPHNTTSQLEDQRQQQQYHHHHGKHHPNSRQEHQRQRQQHHHHQQQQQQQRQQQQSPPRESDIENPYHYHQPPRRVLSESGHLPPLPELSLHLRSPDHQTPRDRLPPLLALTVDKDYLAPALMASVLRLHILQTAMFLRQSNVKLQDELRDTMNAYGEEKSMLRAQLASLRLDLSELHHDNRTVTTDETESHNDLSVSNTSDPELKRLTDFEGESSRTLQLPSIKNLSGPSQGKSKKDTPKESPSRRNKNKDHQSSKSLRFTSDNKTGKGSENNGHSFLDNPNWETKVESQKFLELQRNQEVLRNIGRAQLREKRQSLIRLPTISSAKKRNSLWDSGNNVSRPRGKSTEFELHPYVEDAIILSRKHFVIPSIKDPQRSEIVLKGPTKRPVLNKRKVQFTRPRGQAGFKARDVIPETIITEATTLSASMADVSLEDNTLGNITFDDDTFKNMMDKEHPSDDDDEIKKIDKREAGHATMDTTLEEDAHHKDATDDGQLPPPKPSHLVKKNLELHDNLNNLRVSPLHLYSSPKPSVSPEVKSSKDSDKSVGTKLSLMSQQTELRKNLYLKDVDPKRRNQALSDIMFAVRSRMRENEEALRFGQTPRPRDDALDDFLMSKTSGSLNASSVSSLTPRGNYVTPRKGKTTKRGPTHKTERSLVKRKGSNSTEVQTYLRKMYRQRKTIDRMTGMNYKVSHFAGHKQLRMVAQQA